VHVSGTGEDAEPHLLDLEGVRFPRRLDDSRRVAALAELNASLPDHFPALLRRRVFDRYSAALPFGAPRREVLKEVVAGSLARRHRWTGADCDCTGEP
jgi:hypothetical protein